MDPYKPGIVIPVHDLHEADRKIEEEAKRIHYVEWAMSLMTLGMLWAMYEKLGKPIWKNLDLLSEAHITKDHVRGNRKPGGALAKVDLIEDVLPYNRIQRNMLRFALLQAAEHIKRLSSTAKNTVRMMLIRAQIEGTHPKQLADQFRAVFKVMDRDWRRVAVTESVAVAVNGYIMSQGEGQKVIAQSMTDACPWCKSMLHGKLFIVTHQPPDRLDDPIWDTHIWPGKNNVGRSRHIRSKNGPMRVSSELWKPCIPLHPHCRCRYVAFNPKYHEVGKDGFMRGK